MMRYLKFFSVILFLFFTFAQAKIEASQNASLIDHFDQNGFAGVKKIEGRKLYLDKNVLIPTSQGIQFCGDNGDFVSIQTLYSNEKGCHIVLEESEIELVELAWRGWDGSILNKCPGCGLEYFLTCKNPECPLKKKEEESEDSEDETNS